MSTTPPAAPRPEPGEALRQALHDLLGPLRRDDAPGGVVAVAHQGRLLIREGFGLASVPLAVPNTPAVRMRIGSTSKHFTCLAALLLAEEGRLDVDDPVGRWLAPWPDGVAQPTLRQLMTHTAGVRCYLDLLLLASGTSMRPRGATLQLLRGQSALNFAPGTEFLYSNGGYHLLSHVIARAAGMPFEEVLRTRILEPLGMLQTASVPDDALLLPGLATQHVPQPGGGWRRGGFPLPDFLGEGALVSTVDDMLKWLAHLRSPGIVGRPSTWRQMLEPARLQDGEPLPYALGLMRHAYRGVEVIHHAGGVVGGTCQMLTVPAHGLDIVIMLNGAPVNPMELAWRIVDEVLGPQALQAPRRMADAARFAALVGARYRDPVTRHVIEFAVQGPHLALVPWNLMPVPLHDDGDTLRIGVEDMPETGLRLPVAELLAGDGPPAVLHVLRGRRPVVMKRLQAEPRADTAAARALVGRYAADDLRAQARVVQQGDELELHLQADAPPVRCTLRPWGPDLFALNVPEVDDVPLGGVLSVTHEAGRVTGLLLDSFRTRGLWLRRLADGEAD